MHRFTFVVQIHPDGISTLENVRSHQLVQLADLAEVARRSSSGLRA